MANISILVVEDDPIIARDIEWTLQALGYEVGAVAHDATSARAHLLASRFDLAMLDIHLGPGWNGIELGKLIRGQYDFPVIFLTSFADRAILEEAKLAMPVGYVVKPFSEKDLLAAVEIGLANFAQRFIRGPIRMEALNTRLATPFTQREFDLLLDICLGLNNRQLAEKHFISLNTVKTHVKHIFEKRDAHSRPEAMAAVRTLTDQPMR